MLKKSSWTDSLILAYFQFLKFIGSEKPVTYKANLIKRTLCYVVRIAPLVKSDFFFLFSSLFFCFFAVFFAHFIR